MNRRGPLSRIDAYPYRHRLAEVMTRPVATAPPGLSLGEAAARMDALGISSLLVEGLSPGVPAGIVTERDVLRALSRHGGDAPSLPLSAVMSGPVHGLSGNAFVYQALGRMERLGVRHLLVLDGDGCAAGIVTARALLRRRAGEALALGDRIQVAPDGAGLAAVRARLPALAAALLAEDVSPLDVAAVLAEVLRDLTARAAELAAADVERERGPPPAPWCVLALGSAGRGETLLAFDQDNALAHGGGDADDPWYAALAERMCATLAEAGVPRCPGGVMAVNPLWRHGSGGWRAQGERWIAAAGPQELLEVDVFFDFVPVFGNRPLAGALRGDMGTLARDTGFLKNLGAQLDGVAPPLTLFGGLRTDDGRVDLKLGALWPVASAARVLALRHGVTVTGTPARLDQLAGMGALGEEDRAALRDLFALAVRLLLDQQIADAAAGLVPGPRVDVTRLDRPTRRRLRDALKVVALIPDMVREGLTATSAGGRP